MDESFEKYGGFASILVGISSILYAVFFLVVSRQAPQLGAYVSWTFLAIGGFLSSLVYVAVYQRLKTVHQGFALWALFLGEGAAIAQLHHGAFQNQLISAMQGANAAQLAVIQAARQLPSQIDPAGLAAFFLVGIVSFVFGYLITRSQILPRALGILGMVNGVVLILLFVGSATAAQALILISGGLTSVILGPIWWIWLGIRLMKLPILQVEIKSNRVKI